MDNEKLKKQLRDMCIAADGLATAMHLFYANVSSDILDDIIAQAKKENLQQEELDKWVNMKRTIETPRGPVRVVNTDEQPIEIKTQREPTFDSNPKCYFCGGVIEGLPWIKEGKPACKKCCDNAHHCGQDCDYDDACCQAGSPCGRSAVAYDPNESQPVDTKPAITGESLRNLLGMQVCRCNVPCDVCAIDKRLGACVKLELVGGHYICLAPTPNTTIE